MIILMSREALAVGVRFIRLTRLAEEAPTEPPPLRVGLNVAISDETQINTRS